MLTKQCKRGHIRTTKQCNECKNLSQRKKYKDNPEWAKLRRNKTREWGKKNPEKKAAHKRKYKYGILPEEFARLESLQDGLCAICKTKATLCVDHRHEVDLPSWRGLLCKPCNLGLGLFSDDAFTLLSAALYLDEDVLKKLSEKAII